MRPRSFRHGSMATRGLGPEGTVLTRVRVAMRAPPSRSAASPVAPYRRVLRRISTPRFIKRRCAKPARLSGSSGRMSGPAWSRMTLISSRMTFRKLFAAARTKSLSSATASTPDLGVPLDIRLLEDVDRVISQGQGIAQVLERQGMLRQTRLAGEARHVAERDHEMVVRHVELLRPESGRRRHPPAFEVDALDHARVEIGPGAQPADRGDVPSNL